MVTQEGFKGKAMQFGGAGRGEVHAIGTAEEVDEGEVTFGIGGGQAARGEQDGTAHAFLPQERFAETAGLRQTRNGAGTGEGGDATEAEDSGEVFDNAAMDAAFGEEGFQLLGELVPGFGGKEIAILGKQGLDGAKISAADRPVAKKVQVYPGPRRS